MGSNFSINPTFQKDFDNSIQEFNKTFSKSVDETNKRLSDSDFDKIFNSMSQNQTPIQAGTQYYIGMDAINAQKIDNSKLSDSQKMVKDIQNGFSKSLNDLNDVTKQAETDFETFASGGDISIHDVMISAQKSNLAMQMAIQLRSQMLSAYNEFKSLQF